MSGACCEHGAISWWKEEPQRRQRDHREIAELFPDLSWYEPERAVRGAGGWHGRLPAWPFTRPAPAAITTLGNGLLLELVYPQAYPAIPPRIFPLDPAPQLAHYTHHCWHLNGDGSLCLLQDASAWTGRESVIDLLLKAAGWRIEFALLQAGLIEAMTEIGIVNNANLDSLLDALPGSPSGSPSSCGPDEVPDSTPDRPCPSARLPSARIHADEQHPGLAPTGPVQAGEDEDLPGDTTSTAEGST